MAPIRIHRFVGLWDKADEVEKYLTNLQIQPGAIARVFVEENAKRFAPGMTSADTILTLAKFNGIVSYIMHKKYGAQILDVPVSKGRSILGIKVKGKNQKEQVFQHNLLHHPEFPWITHEVKGEIVFDGINRDSSDAFVVVRSGQLIYANKQ